MDGRQPLRRFRPALPCGVPARHRGLSRLRGELKRRSRLQDRLHLDLYPDLLRDEQAAVIEWHVPGQIPVLTVDSPRGREDGAVATPWVGCKAEVLDIKTDRSANVTDRQLASQLPVRAVPACRPAGERRYRVSRGIEEVRRPQMLVAGLAARVDRRHVDGDLGGAVAR